MELEPASMSKHDVYDLVSGQKGCKIFILLFVFMVKPDGQFKARFYAQRISQVSGTDFGNTYTLVSCI